MQKKSIYKYASEAGLPMGIYLSVMSACLLLSIKLPALPMLILPLALGFPVLLWYLIKNISKAEPSYLKFSSLWLGGIYTVIFGTLICMFLSAAYIVVFEPNFVGMYVNNALLAVESSPVASEYEASIAMMRNAIDAHILPTGLEFLSTMAWFTCFCGSMISLIIAGLIVKNKKGIERRFPAQNA